MHIVRKSDAVSEQFNVPNKGTFFLTKSEPRSATEISRELAKKMGPVSRKVDAKVKGKVWAKVRGEHSPVSVWEGVAIVEKLLADNKPEEAMVKLNQLTWQSVEGKDLDNAVEVSLMVSGDILSA